MTPFSDPGICKGLIGVISYIQNPPGVQETITEALRVLSALSVSGDAVDLMAAAKAHLRDAVRLAEIPEVESDG